MTIYVGANSSTKNQYMTIYVGASWLSYYISGNTKRYKLMLHLLYQYHMVQPATEIIIKLEYKT